MKVSYNNDIITLTPDLKVQADSPYPYDNAVVTFTIPTGLSYVSSSPTKGTYDKTQKKWIIGTVNGNSTESIKDFKLKVTNINNAPFTITATLTANGVDNNSSNNTFSWTIEADTCAPAAGANPDISSCLCGSVGTNDTRCTKGDTEWRINQGSITNGELRSWNITNGDYEFSYKNDPSLPITFTYDLYCVQGASEYLIAQNVPVTIRPQITDKKAFNHTRLKMSYDELSEADKTVLSEQYPDIDIQDFCWAVLKNSHNEVTSGEPQICDSGIDNKTTFQSLPILFLPQSPNTDVSLPENPEELDLHIVKYPNAVVFYTYNGVTWVRSDFAPRILNGDVEVDSNTKTVTLGILNGNDIEIDLSDLFN